jgi:restriction system protein
MIKEPSDSKKTAVKTLYEAFKILKKSGGELSRKELIKQMETNLKFSDWELERYESNGQYRWLTIFMFYSIDAIKSGFLRKEKGTWYLTKEGEEVMQAGEM